MEKKRILYLIPCLCIAAAISVHYLLGPWGFYWKVSEQEAAYRSHLVRSAENWLGLSEYDNSHQTILDIYNSHEPLAQGYTIQNTDSWCAAFVSAAAIEADLTGIIPTECSCERQISLWQDLNRWYEDDNTIPLPGDLIYYNWDQKRPGENSGWSDHVGIVVGTKWPFVKVIEGNYDDQVKYRILLLGDIHIRGYGKPDYPK